MKKYALGLSPDASVCGVNVKLEAFGLKPLLERNIDKEKLRKRLLTVFTLHA